MIKTLESAIEKIKALPPDTQAAAAEILELLAASGTGVWRIPENHKAAIQEGLDQAERHEFVSDGDLERFWKKCGL